MSDRDLTAEWKAARSKRRGPRESPADTQHNRVIAHLSVTVPGFQTRGMREAVAKAICPQYREHLEAIPDDLCQRCNSAILEVLMDPDAPRGSRRIGFVSDGFVIDLDPPYLLDGDRLYRLGRRYLTLYEVEDHHRLTEEKLALIADLWWLFDGDDMWHLRLAIVDRWGHVTELDLPGFPPSGPFLPFIEDMVNIERASQSVDHMIRGTSSGHSRIP